VTSDLEADNFTALIGDGDLVEYLLSTAGLTRKKAKTTDADAPPPAPVGFGPLHRPGSWPFGINPPGPNTCHPDCGCAIKPRPPEHNAA
jgi:hypothetical protein